MNVDYIVVPSKPNFENSRTNEITIGFKKVGDDHNHYVYNAKAVDLQSTEMTAICEMSNMTCTVRDLQPERQYYLYVRACISTANSPHQQICSDYSTEPLIAYTLSNSKPLLTFIPKFNIVLIKRFFRPSYTSPENQDGYLDNCARRQGK